MKLDEVKPGPGEDVVSPDFRAVFDAAPMPLLLLAPPDWRIVAANISRLEVTGTTLAHQIDRSVFETFPDDPDDKDATGVRNLRASLERALATKATDRMPVQRYALRDAGGRFVDRWWWPVNVPVLSPDGEVQLVIHLAEDVTEIVGLRGAVDVQDKLVREQQALIDRLQSTEATLRQREHHLQLMVDELNHRVKNALATVQSIVSQTLRSFGIKEAGEAVEGRLLTLAAAHDVITTEYWSGADLREIINLAAAPYNEGAGNRFELEGPQLKVPPRIAVALALILHELSTNAVKYGSLSVAGGSVRVRWNVAVENENEMLQLVWSEIDGPPVTTPTRQGFGSRLIVRSAAELGAASLVFDRSGLRCELFANLTPQLSAPSGGVSR